MMRRAPASTYRRREPDAVQARQLWRALAEEACALARGVEDGRAWAEPLDFRVRLAVLPKFPTEHGDAFAGHVEALFRHAANAMLTAGTEDRRALAAPVFGAAGSAIEDLLADVIAAQVAHSRRILGERDDD